MSLLLVNAQIKTAENLLQKISVILSECVDWKQCYNPTMQCDSIYKICTALNSLENIIEKGDNTIRKAARAYVTASCELITMYNFHKLPIDRKYFRMDYIIFVCGKYSEF